MAHATQPAASGTAEDAGLAAANARVHAAFDAVAAAASAAPRPAGPTGAALRRPLGRIVSLAQYRDVYDQRISHVIAAEARAATLEAAGASALARVLARLLGDLAALVEGAGGTASDCFAAIADMAEDAPAEAREGLTRAAADGRAAAEDLLDTAVLLADAADARSLRVVPGAEAGGLAGVDLGWLRELYTMEEERQSHDTALAAALAGAGASQPGAA